MRDNTENRLMKVAKENTELQSNSNTNILADT